MLRKFTNAKTGQTFVIDKNMELTKENMEAAIGEEIKGTPPLQEDKKDS